MANSITSGRCIRSASPGRCWPSHWAFLIPAGDEAAVRTELEQLYRKLAAELLEPKVSDAAGPFGLTYRHVRVGGARGRWGSCSRDGGLIFSWRLVRLPSWSTTWSSMSSPTGSNSTTSHATA
ncbi:MAG: YgjP-like metallopeptidase domain-containing protein [Victivallis sp.]